MFSRLRKGIVYRDVSTDISEHDDDYESDLWNYDGKDVYRGRFDPTFVNQNLLVYSLYDDSKRIGIAEHEINAPEVFCVMWFYDTPFGTLFQDPNWKCKNETLWSLMSHEAYQDCLESDFKDVRDRAINSGVFLMTPYDCISLPQLYSCEKCGKKSFEKFPCGTPSIFDLSQFRVLFVNDEFVMFEKPLVADSTLSSQPLNDAREQPESELELEQAYHHSEPLPEQSQEPETPQPYPEARSEHDQSHPQPHHPQRYLEPSHEHEDTPEHSEDAT